MVINKIILLSQIAGYAVSCVLSFCVSIPLVLNFNDFDGHCLLNTKGFFNDSGNFVPTWGSSFYCVSPFILSVLLTIGSLYSLVKMSLLLHNNTDSNFIFAFWDTVTSLIAVVFLLIHAILVTTGFARWCSTVTQRFPSCQAASIMTFDDKEGRISPEHFFIQMGTLQFGIWVCFVTWVFLLVLASRKLFILHERDNLIISMSRERRRYTSKDYKRIVE